MNDLAGIRAQIGFSVCCLIISLVLAVWFVTPVGGANFAGDSFVGPATWPRTMLLGIAACAALLLLRNAFLYAETSRDGPSPAAVTSEDDFDNRKAALGVVILILYVGAIPVIGFALATAAFFMMWLPFGGVRRLRVVAGVTVIGTVALLYTFVKLTTLPLDRGIGLFDGLTVSLYKLLGIY